MHSFVAIILVGVVVVVVVVGGVDDGAVTCPFLVVSSFCYI